MGMSIWHLLLILVVVFVFFGAGRLPQVMGDIGKGVRSLRDGLKADADKEKPINTVDANSSKATVIEHETSDKTKG